MLKLKNLKKGLVAGLTGLLAFASVAVLPVTVYAEDSIPTDTVGSVENSSSAGSSSSSSSSTAGTSMPSSKEAVRDSLGLPNVTIDQIGEKVTSTGNEIVDWIRSGALVFFVGTFVASAITMVAGAVSKKATVMPGIIGMICSVIGFSLVWWAPYLVALGKTLFEF